MRARPVGSVLYTGLKAVQIYGANTGVGKSVVSTALCRALRRKLPHEKVHYLKPISTGPLGDADDRHVSLFAKGVSTKCLFQFSEPTVSADASQVVTDEVVARRVQDELSTYAQQGDGIAIVETAGGVLSPAPSGTSQADLYRILRLPVLLVGDHRLGGIGSTISAWESLYIRGYDVQSIVLFQEDTYGNHAYLKDYFADRGVTTYGLPPPPEPALSPAVDEEAMEGYYDRMSKDDALDLCITELGHTHIERIAKLLSLPARADRNIWHPFTQHQTRRETTLTAIDSAYGDDFQIFKADAARTDTAPNGVVSSTGLLGPARDGSASWWTQGLGHGNPRLALTAAHAAGRYGHVMFADAIHEPAMSLAETLIKGLDNSRLTRVFYTDNGSTGMEVAVKMALKAATQRYGWDASDEVLILGLKGSYHGDTIGTMDCSEPSVYNKKVEWYRGRGWWFDFPEIKMRKGVWYIEPPAGMEQDFGSAKSYTSLDKIFDLNSRDGTAYEEYVERTLQSLVDSGKRFGALVMEPVILGAGGMLFVDPLFQHSLVKVVRNKFHQLMDNSPIQTRKPFGAEELPADAWQGLPVVFDEVFTGLYRLGRFTSSSFVNASPDISVHAKLLTGGLLPLCTTVASETIFGAYLSPEKSDALLHGHSYTAHPIGCEVAKTSLNTMQQMDDTGDWDVYKDNWTSTPALPSLPKAVEKLKSVIAGDAKINGRAPVWSMWSQEFLSKLSHMDSVDSAIAIGSVLAFTVNDPSGVSGYSSTAAYDLRTCLLNNAASGESGPSIHARVLGNVLYLMTSMTTKLEDVKNTELAVLAAIQRLSGKAT
ncbi:hypothetical protein LTR66_011686 [Elasticomyces elasticus]|nr:hypothetical protein LTR66_011686 [Elasticomyces elasticus]